MRHHYKENGGASRHHNPTPLQQNPVEDELAAYDHLESADDSNDT